MIVSSSASSTPVSTYTLGNLRILRCYDTLKFNASNFSCLPPPYLIAKYQPHVAQNLPSKWSYEHHANFFPAHLIITPTLLFAVLVFIQLVLLFYVLPCYVYA